MENSRTPTPSDGPPTRSHPDSKEATQTDTNRAWQTRSRRWMPRPDDTRNHPRRTLVLCFDGTGDQFDDDNSNVVQFMATLKKDDPSKQMVYYQTGLGTRPELRKATKALDSMVASKISSHVRDGYYFLMQNYSEGDSICLFGFSRGAYTALALAGMLQKVGLLPPHNRQQLAFAWKMYKHDDKNTLKLSREFKRTFSIDVNVEFVGVWDTVSSVGIFPRYLPFVNNNSSIHYFRHALALDERRSKFTPNFHREWRDEIHKDDDQDDDGDDQSQDTSGTTFGGTETKSPTEARSPGAGGLEDQQDSSESALNDKEDENSGHKHTEQWRYEQEINQSCKQKTDSLEVWFAGAHADVGGGSVKNETRYALARIPLRWMIRECFKCRTGIIFDMDMLRNEVGLDIDTHRRTVLDPPERLQPSDKDCLEQNPLVKSKLASSEKKAFTWPLGLVKRGVEKTPKAKRKGIEADLEERKHEAAQGNGREPFRGEAYEELRDALSPMYDQLQLSPMWWALEIAPIRIKKQKAIYEESDRISDYIWRANRGRGREVFRHVVDRGLKIHRSVLTRLEAADASSQLPDYVPHIRPHINREPELKCRRRMTQDEWRCGQVEGDEKPWLEWV